MRFWYRWSGSLEILLNILRLLITKKNLKFGMSAVAKQYIVCALFRNILTCFYGNSAFFQLDPPTLLECLG